MCKQHISDCDAQTLIRTGYEVYFTSHPFDANSKLGNCVKSGTLNTGMTPKAEDAFCIDNWTSFATNRRSMHFELMKRGEAPLHRSSTDSSRRGSGTQDPAAESIRMQSWAGSRSTRSKSTYARSTYSGSLGRIAGKNNSPGTKLNIGGTISRYLVVPKLENSKSVSAIICCT